MVGQNNGAEDIENRGPGSQGEGVPPRVEDIMKALQLLQPDVLARYLAHLNEWPKE